MGLMSWLSRRKDQRRNRSLIRNRYDDPRLAKVQQDAAADIAAVESNDKYFDPDAPGQQPGD